MLIFEISSSEGLSCLKVQSLICRGGGAINITIVFVFVVADEFIYTVQERIEAADKPNYFSVFYYFTTTSPLYGVEGECIFQNLINFYG